MKKFLLILISLIMSFLSMRANSNDKSLEFTGKFKSSISKETVISAKLTLQLIPEQKSITKKKVRISFDTCPKGVEKQVDFYRSASCTAKIVNIDYSDISIMMSRDIDQTIICSYTFFITDNYDIMFTDDDNSWEFRFDDKSVVSQIMEWLQKVADQNVLLDEYDEEMG